MSSRVHQLPDFSVVLLFKLFTDDCKIGRFSDAIGCNTSGASGACRFFRVMLWPTKKLILKKHVFRKKPSQYQTVIRFIFRNLIKTTVQKISLISALDVIQNEIVP